VRAFGFAGPVLLLLPALYACGSEPQLEIPLPQMAEVDPDVARAIEQVRAAVVADPESAKAWGALADCYAGHHFIDQAIPCYERAEELNPESHLWSYRLGWMRFVNGTGDPVAPLERALVSLGSYYGPAHEAFAQVLMRQGRADEAAQHFRRASELDAENAHAETGLGLIALGQDDLEGALTHLQEALRRNPDHGEAHIAIARVFARLGRDEEARRHAEISRGLPQIGERKDHLLNPNIEPAGAQARTDYGRQLERQGKSDEAAEHYRIAIESNPHSALARRRLAMLLVKDGQRAEAIELLEEAERIGAGTDQTRSYLERIKRGKGSGRE